MRYQPHLDVYRGICILAVFLDHAEFLGCGWVGVQAFFVVSGYFITGVLLEARHESSSGAGYLGHFYARRVLRIFPVYFGYIGLTAIFAWTAATPIAEALQEQLTKVAPYLLTYTYNIYRPHSGAGSAFYGHLWSLSVEEQFYLVWPFFALLLSPRYFFRLCLYLVAAGPIIRGAEHLYYSYAYPEAASNISAIVYYSTFSHIDAFALGAILNFRRTEELAAVFVRSAAKWVPPLLAVASAGMLLVMRMAQPKSNVTTFGWPIYLPLFHASIWGFSLLNLFFFVAIDRIHVWRIVAQNMALRGLGRVSYGFYVFHLPCLWFAYRITGSQRGTFTALNLATTCVAFIVTWAAAELSFRFFESPFLRLRARFHGDIETIPATQTGKDEYTRPVPEISG